jgi:integrase
MPIYEKGKGRYRVIVQFQRQKREQIVIGTKADARAREAQIELELRTLVNELRAVPKFAPFCAGPYVTHAALHLKASTMRNRQYVLEELTLYFGAMRLDEVTPDEAENYAGMRVRHGIAPATVNTELRALARVLSFARERGVLLKPFKFRPLPERGMRKVRAWSAAEIDRLYDAITEHSPKLLPLVVCAVNTGMRRGEVIALEWENVDPSRRVITVWPSKEWQPKNNKPREVPINSVLMHWLGRLPRAGKWVFPCPGLNAPRKNAVIVERPTDSRYAFWPQRSFDRARKAAGLSGGPHCLRHTYATMFLENGGSITKLAEILGHSDTHVTRLYRHLLPGHLDAERERVSFDPAIGVAEQRARQRWQERTS